MPGETATPFSLLTFNIFHFLQFCVLFIYLIYILVCYTYISDFFVLFYTGGPWSPGGPNFLFLFIYIYIYIYFFFFFLDFSCDCLYVWVTVYMCILIVYMCIFWLFICVNTCLQHILFASLWEVRARKGLIVPAAGGGEEGGNLQVVKSKTLA